MKSRLYLPKLESPPRTILEYLAACFPHIPEVEWQDRVRRGQVHLADGTVLMEDAPYTHGVTLHYSRHVAQEPEPDEEPAIVFQDENILVADKPHGMVVTPAGNHFSRSLLVRLERCTGLDGLAPLHRLDRDTAGLVLFAVRAEVRHSYQRLFQAREIQREYSCIASLTQPPLQRESRVCNRMESGEPWFRRRIAENSGGEPNAITNIELQESGARHALFRLRPETGKKHQLRVHMASLGFPIVGDTMYPEIREAQASDPPLQLLAARFSFNDPLSGEPRSFTSMRQLLWPME